MSLPTFAAALRSAGDLCGTEQRMLKAKVLSGAVAIERLSRSLRWMIALHKSHMKAPASRFDAAVLEYAHQVLECYGDPSDHEPFEPRPSSVTLTADPDESPTDNDRCK